MSQYVTICCIKNPAPYFSGEFLLTYEFKQVSPGNSVHEQSSKIVGRSNTLEIVELVDRRTPRNCGREQLPELLGRSNTQK